VVTSDLRSRVRALYTAEPRNVSMPRQAIIFPFLLVVIVHRGVAAVDVSGMYTATIQNPNGTTTTLQLTLDQSGATPLPGQPGPSVTGTMEVSGTPCFTSLTFTGALDGNVLNGAFTDGVSRVDIQATVHADHSLATTYNISAGPCAGRGGMFTFTPVAPTPTPTVGAQTLPVSGTIRYLGAQGPVSATRPIEVLLFNQPIGSVQSKPLATATVPATPGDFTFQVPAGVYYLAYYLDFVPPSAPQVGEPFRLYNGQLTPPGTALTVSGSGVTGLNLTFDDSGILSGIAGTVTYTGALGSVSDKSRLIVQRFSNATVAGPELDQTTVKSNGGRYDLITFDTATWYLVGYLDLNNNRVRDGGEPFTIYKDKGAPPADPVTASTTQTSIDITFGDENVSSVTTATPTPSSSAPPTPTRTVTSTSNVTAAPTATPTPTQPTPVTTCVGDCNGGHSVTVDELLTVATVGLGNAESSACPRGIPARPEVDVSLMIQAENNALNGCPAPLYRAAGRKPQRRASTMWPHRARWLNGSGSSSRRRE
jgi:hypothetical protein